MRQIFFLGIVIVGVLAGIIYLAWSIISQLYQDWLMGKDVNKIKSESATVRAQRELEAAKRLDNGCEHAFGETFGGFPPNACHKCGMEKTRPDGACDHVWKLSTEAVPCSYCENCGKRYISPTVSM